MSVATCHKLEAALLIAMLVTARAQGISRDVYFTSGSSLKFENVARNTSGTSPSRDVRALRDVQNFREHVRGSSVQMMANGKFSTAAAKSIFNVSEGDLPLGDDLEVVSTCLKRLVERLLGPALKEWPFDGTALAKTEPKEENTTDVETNPHPEHNRNHIDKFHPRWRQGGPVAGIFRAHHSEAMDSFASRSACVKWLQEVPNRTWTPSKSTLVKNGNRWLPLLAVASSSISFAFQAVCAKKLSLAGIATLEIIVLRGAVQTIGSCLYLAAIRRPASTWMGNTRQEVFLLCWRALLGFVGIAFGFESIVMLPLAAAQVLGQVLPMFTSLYAWIFLGERWHCSECISALLGLFGVILIARPKDVLLAAGHVSESRLLGVTFSLLSSACAGGAFVFIRVLGTRVKVHWLVVMLYQAIFQITFGSFVLASVGGGFTTLNWPAVRWALAGGGLGFCGTSLMTWGMQREKSATASVVQQCLAPVSAMLLQSTFFPMEALEVSTLAGFCVMFIGLLVTIFGKMRRDSAYVNATSSNVPTQQDDCTSRRTNPNTATRHASTLIGLRRRAC